MSRNYCAAIFVLFAFFTQTGLAQSTVNPDISIIPRFRLDSDNGANTNDALGFAPPRFRLEEFEVALQGYLNPYARADIFLTKPGTGNEPIELEEIYASFLRGLPLDMNLKIGKFRSEFGKLNSTHPHAWPFITTPFVMERFLGEEGLNDLAVSFSFILPTGDLYSRLSFDLLDGGSIQSVDPQSITSSGMALVDTLGAKAKPVVVSRLTAFWPLTDESDLEVSVSGMSGVHDPYRGDRFWYGGGDFKYKWKPDAYTSLTTQGEFIWNARTVGANASLGTTSPNDVKSFGMYVAADYQFQKIYDVGLRYDWTESPYASTMKKNGISVFAGYSPVEETTAFRLQIQRANEEAGGAATTVNSVALQFLFSLGPHKAHPF